VSEIIEPLHYLAIAAAVLYFSLAPFLQLGR